MVIGVLITISFVLLASPIVWLACFNVVGLRRLSVRLADCEDDIYNVRNKARSLQTQVSKKSGISSDRINDDKIDQEISAHIKSNGDSRPMHLYGREVKEDATGN